MTILYAPYYIATSSSHLQDITVSCPGVGAWCHCALSHCRTVALSHSCTDILCTCSAFFQDSVYSGVRRVFYGNLPHVLRADVNFTTTLLMTLFKAVLLFCCLNFSCCTCFFGLRQCEMTFLLMFYFNIQ